MSDERSSPRSMSDLILENAHLKKLLAAKESEVLEHIDRAYNKNQEANRLKEHDRMLSTALTVALRKLADLDAGLGVAELDGQEAFQLQYGVQIVWTDPVKAGAVLPGHADEYVPKWTWFDEKLQGDRFERRMRLTTPEGDIKAMHRGMRWALEVYTDPEVTP